MKRLYMALKEVKHLMGVKGHCQRDMSKFARFYDITSSLVIYTFKRRLILLIFFSHFNNFSQEHKVNKN